MGFQLSVKHRRIHVVSIMGVAINVNISILFTLGLLFTEVTRHQVGPMMLWQP